MAEKNPDELGALWIKEGPKGVYLTGKVNGVAVVVFRNTFKKEGSNQPDWKVLRARGKDERPPSQAARHSEPPPPQEPGDEFGF